MEGAAEDGDVGGSEALGDVEASDFGNRDGVGVAGEEFDFVVGGDLAFACDGDVETGAGAGEEALDHVVGLEANA